ncbi:amino acid adenylation domain-containing protein [Breoghania corrubedonensis]|uniref:Amino acid adenylation domain-containing protein n=1 Tax=Breoghania corrubedonensis TaxID=665038 RepID=A0A2T5VA50_9HYPH|nr:amino acid adenylation domain-containing protein [Breoghania corrubedonensis]PTW60626.1 amino acid adenylation domain-containing protein [Breoghania corrubedonensis]
MSTKSHFHKETDCTNRHLAEAIAHNARITPKKTALADSRLSLDYRTLDRFSTRFALWLCQRGCRPGDRVVMLAPRQAILVAAIVGTFKAGCVHVPLDAKMPAGRVEYILKEIEPAFVITDEEHRATVDEILEEIDAACGVMMVGQLEGLLSEELACPSCPLSAELLPRFDADRPAYCIYTSGSTGHPKGVVIAHSSLAPFFEGTAEVYDVTASSVCASFSPLNFDVYLMDMLFPLAQGAELHVHDDLVVPDFLFATIRDNKVTHFSAWGMMLGLIAQAEDFETARLPHLQTILTGTDVPDVKTVQRWMGKNVGVRVINAYGPTEVTCASTAHVIDEIEPQRTDLYPIGKPLKHVTARLVDEAGGVVTEPGVMGELLVGGVQVMQAYWNREEETAKRVVTIDGIRYYRTGDVCSYLADGAIYYHGRRDNEVNIGGYRVHLNEIQRVICSVPHVHSAEVVVLETGFGEKLLAAGVLFERGEYPRCDSHIEVIRRRLTDELPAYMVPRHVVGFAEFPLLSSGKADRKALAEILQQRVREPAGAGLA